MFAGGLVLGLRRTETLRGSPTPLSTMNESGEGLGFSLMRVEKGRKHSVDRRSHMVSLSGQDLA